MSDMDFKAIRAELGLTQKDLGELLGIDPTQISRAENGHETPPMYAYALQGLKSELAGDALQPTVDAEPLRAKIAELEAELQKQGIEASNALARLETSRRELMAEIEGAKAPAPQPAAPAPEAKPKRGGLGRRSNAVDV
jgi:transcriptional regulator with XRE-family HTH domain